MTIEIKAFIFVNRKLGGYYKRIHSLHWLNSPKEKYSPNVKRQFDGGAL